MDVKDFLINLQKDLLEDREKEECQADPIYYGIIDTETLLAPEDDSDGTFVYDNDTCECVSLEEFICDERENGEEWAQQPTEFNGFSVNDDGEIEIEELDLLLDTIHTYCDNVTIVPFQYYSYIRKDVLFLTREDAEKHLKENSHHYTKDAHSYAMTAFRSPRYETLLKALKQVDWKNSEIKLLEASRP